VYEVYAFWGLFSIAVDVGANGVKYVCWICADAST